MKKFLFLGMGISLLVIVACTTASTPKPKDATVVEKPAITEEELQKADELEAPVEDEGDQKGPPPPLPSWAKMPHKKSVLQILKSRVDTLRLTLEDNSDMRIPKPYKIFQIGDLTEREDEVVIPVRVEHNNFWIRGYLDTNQVGIWIPGGTRLFDKPSGLEVGFVSDKIPVVVKKISGYWIQVAYEMNKKCSPIELVVWVTKKALMKHHSGKVPFPSKYRKLPKKKAPNDVPYFELYSRRRGDLFITSIPLCKVSDQQIFLGRKAGRRVKVYFKPSQNSPIIVTGWAGKDIASDNPPKGSCTCGTFEEEKSSNVPTEENDIYQVRTMLPLYLKPDKKASPVGVVSTGVIPKGAVKDILHKGWGKVFLGDAFKLTQFYVPYHDNYFLP